jgi:uridine kinase
MTVLVAITGGSGSGKSTLAAALQAALPPGAAVMVSEDWYYRDCSAFPAFDPATFDFDDIIIRDHALLIQHLQALRVGKAVTAPEYDFVTHSRRTDAGVMVTPAEVVIVEGSHLLCAAEVAAAFDLRIYLDTPDDVRFIRRLLRDQAERGRTARSIVDQYLATVRPAHERLTGPSRGRADVVVVDVTTTVDRPDAAAIARLAAPLLNHPIFRNLTLADPTITAHPREGGDPVKSSATPRLSVVPRPSGFPPSRG